VIIFLQNEGYENAANLAGGFVEWGRDGLPVQTDKLTLLRGSCMCQLKRRKK
jgi:3-mercaptopyruvate sulfurtransferase SseA